MNVSKELISSTTVGCLLAGALAYGQQTDGVTRGPFQFSPLPSSAACIPGGVGTFPAEQPFLLPDGFAQTVVAREGDGGTIGNWDMNTLNESGPHAGRFLYRTHEVPTNGMVSVTDLETGETRVLAQRIYWDRLDGIVWTPWKTLLIGEEMRPERQPSVADPRVPQAQAGLMYELDPVTGEDVPLPALGARAHEGMRLDPQGNVYGIPRLRQAPSSTAWHGPAATSSSSSPIAGATSRAANCTRSGSPFRMVIGPARPSGFRSTVTPCRWMPMLRRRRPGRPATPDLKMSRWRPAPGTLAVAPTSSTSR